MAGRAGRAVQAWEAGRTQSRQGGQRQHSSRQQALWKHRKRHENAHSGIHTRASRKPTEMSRCSRNRKRIRMLKPLNTNGNGFWRLPNTRRYDWLRYTLHTFKMCSDGVSQEHPGVPVRICLESTHTTETWGCTTCRILSQFNRCGGLSGALDEKIHEMARRRSS